VSRRHHRGTALAFHGRAPGIARYPGLT
jgi:hypothetical protein